MNKKVFEIQEEESIDFIKILTDIWINKELVIKVSLYFFILGIILSISLSDVYRASSIFYPHIESSDNSQDLRNLAGIAGIDITNDVSSNVPSNLYPLLINSPIFKIKILDEVIYHNGNKMTYREYIRESHSSFSLIKILLYPISIIKDFFKKSDENKNLNFQILQLSEEEFELHEKLDDLIFLDLNESEGFIELSVDDEDPLIASQIATAAEKKLQLSIIDFKLKNIKATYEFTSNQLEIAKQNFYFLQDSLAKFKDNNRNIRSDLFLNQLSRIESEYSFSRNIYNELGISKERTSIDVQKNTPIFTIIKPVVIPNETSEPKRVIIIIIFTFLGFIVSSFYVLIKPFLFNVLNKINN